ncbi:hypothetical protein M408DRAFT_28639 [Serendipita vermifera MAFF 305830]|uniref:Transmembrane protein n=1 Tax=Serendipita vermifera MAFF 305830 TaxID=933852 RepID=A0A0C2W7U2_SERVB|nr:hypothetical protein M408DRAFT_28639 [Serendipita vermifera MAFF 305830]
MSRTIVVDDADSGIQYTGSWTALTDPLYLVNPEHMRTIHESHQQGNTITYTFTGTRITVYGSLSSPGRKGIPSSTYQIDSGMPVRFNSTGELPNVSTATSNISHIPFYTSPTLPEGQHTITITVEPGTNTPSFYFDFFVITTSNWQAGPSVIVDDTDTGLIEYGPGWTQAGVWREYGGSVRGTPPDTNGTAVFRFQGTSLSVYASLNGYYGGIPWNAAFAVDDRPVYLYRPEGVSTSIYLYHQRIFHTEGLADNVEHRLTMTAIGAPGVPAWFFDFLVFTPSSAPITSVVPEPGSSITTPIVGGAVPTGITSGGSVSGTSSGTLMTIDGAVITLPGRAQQASPSTGPSSQQNGNASSPPTGALIGGVVGGVAVLFLIIFAFFWRRRQNRYGALHLKEKGEMDGSTTDFLAMQRMPGSVSNFSSNDDSSMARMRARPSHELAHRMAPPPMKGRFNFRRQEEAAASRAAQRQTMFSSSAGDAPLSPSATSSSVPGMSQSEEPDESEVSVSPAGAIRQSTQRRSVVQGQQRQHTTIRAQNEAGKNVTPFSSFQDSATAASTAPMSSAPNVSLVPVREVDAGIRLDSWDLDDGVPDTLPPLYSRFR